MNFFKNMMKRLSTFNFFDVQVFKLYLFAVALFLAKLIPALLVPHYMWYLIPAIAGTVFFIPILFTKKIKFTKKSFTGKLLERFNHFSMFQISIWKTTIALWGLAFATMIPVLMEVNIAWYTGATFFGLGYMLCRMFRNN